MWLLKSFRSTPDEEDENDPELIRRRQQRRLQQAQVQAHAHAQAQAQAQAQAIHVGAVVGEPTITSNVDTTSTVAQQIPITTPAAAAVAPSHTVPVHHDDESDESESESEHSESEGSSEASSSSDDNVPSEDETITSPHLHLLQKQLETAQQQQQRRRWADPTLQMISNHEWCNLIDNVLNLNLYRDGDESNTKLSVSGIDVSPVVNLLKRVLESVSFQQHVERNLDIQFTRSFLVSILAHYTASVLPRDQYSALLKYMRAHIEQQLSRIFKYQSSYTVHITTDIKSARIYALQYAIHQRYPLLAQEGSSSLSRPPVFYLTEGSPTYHALDRLGWELFASKSSFRIIPQRLNVLERKKKHPEPVSHHDDDNVVDYVTAINTYSMDLSALEREIQQDKAKGRIPCAVLACFGADLHQSAPYQCDDLESIRKICDRHGMWLHAEGTSMLLSTASSAPTSASTLFEHADSVTCEPLGLFNISGSLGLTFMRQDQQTTNVPSQPFSREIFHTVFLLWFQLVSHPDTYISSRVEEALTVSRHLKHQLSRQPYPVIVGPAGGQFPHLLFFQLCPPSSLTLSDFNLDINSLNRWLYMRLGARREETTPRPESTPSTPTHGTRRAKHKKKDKSDGTETPGTGESKEATDGAAGAGAAAGASVGTAESTPQPSRESIEEQSRRLRRQDLYYMFDTAMSQTSYQGRLGFLFHPLTSISSSACLQSTTSTRDITNLVHSLTDEMDLIIRAGQLRSTFELALREYEELVFVPREQLGNVFVGVGVVQYVPAFYVPAAQVDALNALLVHKLSQKSPIYVGSITTGKEKRVCTVIQTGEFVRDPECVPKLVRELVETVAKLQLPPDVVENLSRAVVKGIREAEQKLQDSNAAAYRPQALLRQLPVVGRMFGWLAGPNQEQQQSVRTDLSQAGNLGHTYDIRSRELSKVHFALPPKKEQSIPVPGATRSSTSNMVGMGSSTIGSSGSGNGSGPAEGDASEEIDVASAIPGFQLATAPAPVGKQKPPPEVQAPVAAMPNSTVANTATSPYPPRSQSQSQQPPAQAHPHPQSQSRTSATSASTHSSTSPSTSTSTSTCAPIHSRTSSNSSSASSSASSSRSSTPVSSSNTPEQPSRPLPPTVPHGDTRAHATASTSPVIASAPAPVPTSAASAPVPVPAQPTSTSQPPLTQAQPSATSSTRSGSISATISTANTAPAPASTPASTVPPSSSSAAASAAQPAHAPSSIPASTSASVPAPSTSAPILMPSSVSTSLLNDRRSSTTPTSTSTSSAPVSAAPSHQAQAQPLAPVAAVSAPQPTVAGSATMPSSSPSTTPTVPPAQRGSFNAQPLVLPSLVPRVSSAALWDAPAAAPATKQ